MQVPGIVLISIVVGLFAGCLFGAQPSVNGHLGRNLEHPLQAAMISFGSGTVILFLLTIATGNFPPRFTTSPGQLPWWVWVGGTIGVFLVTASLIFVPRVGSLIWLAAVMTGQILAAIMLDHFGWLGNPQVSASPLRLVGALFLTIGMLTIVQAKRMEEASQPPQTAHNTDAFVYSHRSKLSPTGAIAVSTAPNRVSPWQSKPAGQSGPRGTPEARTAGSTDRRKHGPPEARADQNTGHPGLASTQPLG